MFDIGFLELMVVGILGLLVLGPERLPVAARTVGLFIGKIRRTMSNIQDDLERQVRTDELKEKLKDPYATFLDEEESAAKDNLLQNALAKSAVKEDSEKTDSSKK
ncbi:MAG: twin-arginine translocase subunit TatB [Oleispira antarctica]|uniref:Sec-independent protein translocase protein TatB n=1 Tax=Oleispira antarctica RB-8 TaxID=698738 RepID=R4YV31_OLEAN|nr:twin-arginine translocase subunit TatB [Oleispira antarctica]MBQ0790916.1 twin-arginine translocase subunit TatB [Oleispira antarctica]CCK77489.1 Integral membrane protein TatB [Oleispira antarctica RB-8]